MQILNVLMVNAQLSMCKFTYLKMLIELDDTEYLTNIFSESVYLHIGKLIIE